MCPPARAKYVGGVARWRHRTSPQLPCDFAYPFCVIRRSGKLVCLAESASRISCLFEEEELRLIGETWCWPLKIKPKVEECVKRLKAERNRAEDELNMKKDKFIEELDEYVKQAEAFSTRGEISHTNENCAEITSLPGRP